MANEIYASEKVLTSNISQMGNVVSLVCWDNFDLIEETRSGSNTTHVAHGLIIQETDALATSCIADNNVNVNKTKERTFRSVHKPLPPCYVAN